MSNIPTLPDREDMAKQQSQRNTDEARSADLSIEAEDIEAEEDRDVSRHEAVDALTRGKLKP